jgi:heme exporter protein C
MPDWLANALLLIPAGVLIGICIKPSIIELAWKVLALQALVMIPLGAWLGLVWAPPEREMGEVYRIIYAHVPQVWMALLGVTLNFGASLAFLWKKSWTSDALAEASAEVGLYFGIVGVTLGAIWGKPTWGVYWTWDPRLTSAAVMLIYYTGYLALRRFTENPDTRATWSAALGTFGIVIPVTVYFSVKWMKSLHQEQSTPKTVDPQMVFALRWAACAFLCLLIVFVYHRYKIARAALEKEVAPPEALGPPAVAPAKGAA